MKLPQMLTLAQLNTKWSAIINPIISNPLNNGSILKSISLTSGVNTVNHKLGRNLQGWKIIRQRAAASIYDNQDSNQTPDLTLILVASAPVVVDLEVL